MTVCTKYFNYTHSCHCLYDYRLFAWHCYVAVCLSAVPLLQSGVALLFGQSGKWTSLSEECCELSDKYYPYIFLNFFIYTDCQKMIWMWVVNPDQEDRLYLSCRMTYIYMSYRTANFQMLHFIYVFNKYM